MAGLATVDVTVRGAGAFGLATAWACARRGARVRVVEPRHPGAGSSGGLVGALAPHVPEQWNDKKAFQLESLLMAGDWWAGVETASGLSPGYARTGRLQPLADEAAVALARARAEGAARLWQGRADWRVIRAADAPGGVAGWLPPSPSGWLVHDTLSARMSPRAACAALLAALCARGAEIVAEAEPEGVTLWATGHEGLADLSLAFGRPVGAGVKGQSASLRPGLPADVVAGLPQLFAQGVHVVPHADGTVAVGSTSERVFDAPDAVDAQLDAVLAMAAAACPLLEGAPVVDRWAGVRPRSRSRAPILGPWPGRPGTFVANGGFKIGFGLAPGVAEAMADLMLEGRDSIPPGFRVEANL